MRPSRMDELGIQRRPMSDENKMRVVLILVALLAFGGYALIMAVQIRRIML